VISIVIPSYKNSDILRKQLPDFLFHLNGKGYEFEIIIVDDGSNDGGGAEKVAKEFNCRFYQNPVNMGKGGAVKNGMLIAKGDVCLFTDSDIPFEYKNVDSFIEYIQVKGYDLAIGDRTLPESSYFTEISKKRKIGSNIFTFIVGRFITTGVFDTQCGLKAFRRDVAHDLFSKTRITSFAFDVELIYISLKRNYDIKKLPVQLRLQEGGSSVNLLKHSFGMVMDLFKMKINHLKGHYKK